MLIMKVWVLKECKFENGFCKVILLQWCLEKIVEVLYFYLRLSFIVEVFLVVIVCNVWLVKLVVLRFQSKINIKNLKSK